MTTRWKQFVRNKWTKAGAFVLAVVLSGTAVWTVQEAAKYSSEKDISWEMVASRDAWVSQVLQEENNAAITMADMIYNMGGEKAATSEDTLSDTQIAHILYDVYYDGGETYSGNLTDTTLSKKTQRNIETVMYSYLGGDGEDATQEVQSFMNWIKANPGYYDAAKKTLLHNNITCWNDAKKQLQELDDDYLYCMYSKQNGQETLETNVATDTQKSKKEQANKAAQSIADCAIVLQLDPETGAFSYRWDDSRVQKAGQVISDNGWQEEAASIVNDALLQGDSPAAYGEMRTGDVMTIGLRDEALNVYSGRDYDSEIRPLMGYAMALGICLLGVLLCMIVLIWGIGKTPEDDTARLRPEDRIWSEVYWIVGLVPFAVCASQALSWMDLASTVTQPTLAIRMIPPLCGMAGAAIGLACLMPQVRRIKTRTFWDGFLCVRGAKYLLSRWKRGPLFMKVISAAILIPLVCLPMITVPFVMAGLLYAGIRSAERLNAVCDGAKRIRAGETGAHIEVKGGQELRQLADDLNSISEGLQSAVETAVQSERLKSELISNVSHDLKTPLTGIITYVDLMKQLEPGDPRMEEYLQTVDQKTKRLSVLINDLLEASKASSGAMKTDLARVDWEALFQQTCGEMEEKLHAAGLEIRLRTEGRTEVLADGRKLWRIMDNLLTNCVRYAMPNSRVYVEIKEQGSWCVMTMKNISAQELNISADELMERFTRGDRARYTEGSGLGLSIARSLAELMHGSFQITVDGDLFKAEVFMPLWTGGGGTAPGNNR